MYGCLFFVTFVSFITQNELTMKRTLFILTLTLCMGFSASAQEDGPTTTWPYLYSSFRPGTILLGGEKTRAGELNIHVRHGRLHYLDNGNVKEALLTDVMGVEIDGTRYLNWEGAMLRVDAQNEKGCVVASILGDYSALQETGGAYGSSSATSATRKLSSLDMDSQINQNHMLLLQNKMNGKDIPLETRYYLMFDGKVIPANRKDVERSLFPDRKAEWKAWLKTHKIKWKEPQSVLEVLDFLKP